MRVFSSRFKFVSKAVHEEGEQLQHEKNNKFPAVEGASLCTSLTVWRKSLLINCKGFTVIDSCGNLVYRVDNYTMHPHQIILMDASGYSLLTMRRRRKLGLVESWYVYEGEMGNTAVCRVKKSVNILNGGSPKVQAYVYRVASSSDAAYTVEGSYGNRTCKVMDHRAAVVAEIKRKEANNKHASFGIDIFQLIVYPSFHPAFAMALVLLLDQMFT